MTFYNSSDLSCQQCNSTCAACTGSAATQCSACSDPNYLNIKNNTCALICDVGYYADNNTRKCTLCNTNCYTCFNSSTTGCLSCKTGKYLIRENNTCSATCPEHQFQNVSEKVCRDCSSNCLQCLVNETNCAKCVWPDYLRLNNKTCGNCSSQ